MTFIFPYSSRLFRIADRCLTAVSGNPLPEKESPSEYPPHVTQDPVSIITVVGGLIGKVWLVTLYPWVGIGPGEVPVMLPQFLNETLGTKILLTLMI